MADGITTITLESLIACERYATGLDLSHAKQTLQQRIGRFYSSIRGRGIDVSDVRAYQAGDDIRAMNWKVTARTGFAHIKQFEEERERPILVCVDVSQSMRFATRGAFKSIIATKLAASLAWAAYKQCDQIGGVTFEADKLNLQLPRAGSNGLFAFLDMLVQTKTHCEASTPGYLNCALQRVADLARSGSLIFVISDFYDATLISQQTLLQLSQRCDVIAIAIYDPIEIYAPPPNQYFVKNDRNQYASMRTDDSTFSARYEAHFQQEFNTLKTNLSRANIPLLAIMTNQSLSHGLQLAFSRHLKGLEVLDEN